MSEYCICPACGAYINLETDIHRDDNNCLYCNKCDSKIEIN